ncbi:aldo/keto reductase [Halobellus ruber]|uniref:Aldo/keto reductase n=1 Tax=Halobellus ruber TaxID=2761102 RepID=A0A7J9SFV7_9EURY|nr:aldo/keto reductase [Halobellus ruber]MBB6645392.1 aldo/keto reductase [Halobellus ruber]
MPVLGLGTWENTDPEACVNAVATALEAGYRHIDTAQAYGNEEHVGRGIERADVPREDIFLATKVWIDHLSYDDVLASTEESLRKLGVDGVDLLYVHWPAREYDPENTFRAFDELVDDGKTDRIGISNFEPEQVNDAIDHTENPIFANQVEVHPLLRQPDLREHCADHGIEVVAYSPLARGAVFDVPELTEIAGKHGVSEAQVSLAWLREKGVTAIPKATSEPHIRDNLASLDLDLDSEDVATIDAIDRTDRRVDPGWAPW